MGNEDTKQQLRTWIDKAIKEAQNPDPRVKLKRERLLRQKKVSKKYGF